MTPEQRQNLLITAHDKTYIELILLVEDLICQEVNSWQPYVRHRMNCNLLNSFNPSDECTCGLDTKRGL